MVASEEGKALAAFYRTNPADRPGGWRTVERERMTEEGKALTFRMWHQELRNHLIEQGMQGFKQKAIISAFNPRVNAEDMKAYLELLLKEDKVQKFRYKGDFWWRATTEILKQDV